MRLSRKGKDKRSLVRSLPAMHHQQEYPPSPPQGALHSLSRLLERRVLMAAFIPSDA